MLNQDFQRNRTNRINVYTERDLLQGIVLPDYGGRQVLRSAGEAGKLETQKK